MPLEDIHGWNVRNLFNARVTREEAKQKLFSWLYDENKINPNLSRVYDRDKDRKEYWDGERIKTMFGGEIEADQKHALNYIVQSTTADLVLRQMVKVYDFLKDKDSCIAFTIHDSIVLDIVDKERYILPEIKKIFSDTALGEFMVNVKAGKDFAGLKDLRI